MTEFSEEWLRTHPEDAAPAPAPASPTTKTAIYQVLGMPDAEARGKVGTFGPGRRPPPPAWNVETAIIIRDMGYSWVRVGAFFDLTPMELEARIAEMRKA